MCSQLFINISRYIDELKDIISSKDNVKEEECINDMFVDELKTKFPQVSFFDESNSYSYLPFKINMATIENIHGLMHEFCHFIIATPEQRSLINFGLGLSPTDNTSLPHINQHHSIIDPHEQEFYAGILTVIYQQYYGYNIPSCLETMGFEDHEAFTNTDDWYQALSDLTNANLITWDDDGIHPTFQINNGSLKFGCCKIWYNRFLLNYY